jgi:hypothetical protein
VIDPSIEEITLIRREPKRAEMKFFTSRCLLHREVNSNIAALITKLNNPKERSSAGKVKNLRNVPKKAFMNPKSRATQRYAPKPPLTLIPGITSVVAQIAIAKIAQRKNSFMR